MLIGNRYADYKMYSGFVHYDDLPLTSKDIHEYEDNTHMKNTYLFRDLVGSGTLNNPTCSISTEGIKLLSPSVALIEGDIALIQSDDENTIILSQEEIASAGYTHGVMCILGGYVHQTYQSTLHYYGGMKNSIRENDIIDEDLGVQVSTRHQFVWTTLLVDYDTYFAAGNLTISLSEFNAALLGTTSITCSALSGSVRTTPKPTTAEFVDSTTLCIIPILEYDCDETYHITEAVSYRSLQKVGGETKLVQYLSTHIALSDDTSEGDIIIPLNYDFDIYETDIISATYEGITLTPTTDYEINRVVRTITLKNFKRVTGETLIVTLSRIRNESY